MDSTFLSQFIMITDIKTVIFLATLVGVFFLINKLKGKFKFTQLMIVSIFLGIGLGFLIQVVAQFPTDPSKLTWINEVSKWYGLIGYGFMDLLKMLIVPLVLVSIIKVIMNMNQGENLGKLTSKSTKLGLNSLNSLIIFSKFFTIFTSN